MKKKLVYKPHIETPYLIIMWGVQSLINPPLRIPHFQFEIQISYLTIEFYQIIIKSRIGQIKTNESVCKHKRIPSYSFDFFGRYNSFFFIHN